MTPLVKEMIKLVSVNLDPTQMHWFDVTGAIKEYIGHDQKKYLLHPAPYKNMMLVGRTAQGDFMLSVLAESKATIVTGWILKLTGYKSLGSFLFAEHNGEPKVGPVDKPIDPEDQSMMCAIVAMFYASLDMQVVSYVPTPHRANVSRAKHGLKPLYDWHTVVIEPPRPQSESRGGTHASPRRHQARGTGVRTSRASEVGSKSAGAGMRAKGLYSKTMN